MATQNKDLPEPFRCFSSDYRRLNVTYRHGNMEPKLDFNEMNTARLLSIFRELLVPQERLMLSLNLLKFPVEGIRALLKMYKLDNLDCKPELDAMLHCLGIQNLMTQFIMDLGVEDFTTFERFLATSRSDDYQKFLDVLWE